MMAERQHGVTYDLKEGSPIDGDPQVIGQELERIEDERGTLKPEVIVAVAANEANPLHPYFTWDDAEAARKQRLQEARKLVRSVTIRYVDDQQPSGPTRAFVHVRDEDKGSGYQSTTVAMRDQSKRDQVLERALRELERFQDRYNHLEEFADLMDHIDQKLDDHD